MKTKKFKYVPEYSFQLLGIASTDDDYKFSWNCGQLMDLEFVKTKDLEIIDARYPEFQIFSVYESFDFSGNCKCKIVSNKGKAGFLIEELKNIDFFVMVFENEKFSSIEELSASLKSISNVSAVFKLTPENLKSKEKLLF
jgi:hypothetical protein